MLLEGIGLVLKDLLVEIVLLCGRLVGRELDLEVLITPSFETSSSLTQCPNTFLYPFPGGHSRASAGFRLNLKRIHNAG
jgi:hypothetical protein